MDESKIAEETELVLPKKRGRPAKSVIKKLSSGRGRGRPPLKGSRKEVAESTTEDDSGNSIEANGSNSIDNFVTSSNKLAGSGRPPKQGKLKLSHTIVSTGKGRGRPKKEKPAPGVNKVLKKPVHKSPSKKTGRPKKTDTSQEDNSDSDDYKVGEEERRPVGRPNTGAVNLNIERGTGRSKGRPRKTASSVVKNASNGTEDAPPRKRGRPATGKAKPVKAPSGKPRGRPRINTTNALINEHDGDSNKSENKQDISDDTSQDIE